MSRPNLFRCLELTFDKNQRVRFNRLEAVDLSKFPPRPSTFTVGTGVNLIDLKIAVESGSAVKFSSAGNAQPWILAPNNLFRSV